MSLPSRLSAIFLATLIMGALFAPWVAPYSYERQDTRHTLATPD
ncbi:MAG: ABC transporter permease, partial [Nitrospinae bacterium]|nr:ABC transporter permease [Nitrospinota bacterium]